MSEIDEIDVVVSVKEVMSSPVITVLEGDTIEAVAKLMGKNKVGSIIVIDNNGRPIGLITERDIVFRVAGKNLLSNQVAAKSIMSSPLITVNPRTDLKKAAKMMQMHDIRRLIVMDDGKMVGFVSDADIVAITPALVEIISEKVRIRQVSKLSSGFNTIGHCERCDQWSISLLPVEGLFICEECRIELDTY